MNMKLKRLAINFAVFACFASSVFAGDYEFSGGFPTQETIQKAHDAADLNRAVQAYRFFYPTVSCVALFTGPEKVGIVINKVFGTLDTQPKHRGFTLNSDTPYAPVLLDLREGPWVIELPPGPLLGAAMDMNQRWVADMGIPGPDAGKGGKHLLLPPGYEKPIPSGYFATSSPTYRVVLGIRSVPIHGDLKGAIDLIKTVNVHPLERPSSWAEPTWLDLTPSPQDVTPLAWEDNFRFWEVLYEVVNSEPPFIGYHNQYGDLATLGIVKGQPFRPDARIKAVLEQAAKIGSAQMRVEAFADRRPDRVVWKDRKWEWAALRFEDGDFNTLNYADTYARDKWYFQAIASSPAMFRRDTRAGSLYWLGLRDKTGAYLEGGKTYKLTVPQPVPGRLFWSVTVYDAETRSQVVTDQGMAALRSLFELKDKAGSPSVDLYFGPTAPEGKESQWIRTIPGKGWFVYFRIYGPEQPAFDGSWKSGDFEEVK